MEKIYLENARQLFLQLPSDVYYEGRSAEQFDKFIKMLGYIVPNKLTPEELIVYLEILIKDIKEGTCRFSNSSMFKNIFQQYLKINHNFDVWMTYFPSFIEVFASREFSCEFIRLFKKAFYQIEMEMEESFGCVEVKKDWIDISLKDKAEVLASLYNHAKPVGMGIVQYDPTSMTIEVARMILSKKEYSFGYLKGRPIKLSLEEDIVYVGAYNRDNNEEGLAQKAISECKNVQKKESAKQYIKKSEI